MNITLDTSSQEQMTSFVLPEKFNGTVDFLYHTMPIATIAYKNGLKHGWFTLFGKRMWLYEGGKTIAYS